MQDRALIDVYGRFRVRALRSDGRWTLYRLGGDAKRSEIRDVVVPIGATLDGVLRELEAMFHEYGAPNRDLTVIDRS